MTQLIMNDAVMDDITQDGLLNEVKHYWNNRAEGYNEVNVAELAGGKRRLWQEIILRHAQKVVVEYIGCRRRAGFFCHHAGDGGASRHCGGCDARHAGASQK